MAVERKSLTNTQKLVIVAALVGIAIWGWMQSRNAQRAGAKEACEIIYEAKTGRTTECAYDERFNEWVPR